MGKNLSEKIWRKFSSGLNVVDSTIDMQDSDLVSADNVIYVPTGEVESIDAHLPVGNPIVVNGLPATKNLGGCTFNGDTYLMASNGIVARLVYLDGDDWVEVASTNFDKDALVDFAVYNHKLWFVNGKTTGTYVLNFLDESRTLSGITAAGSGLPAGINHIILHLERIWTSCGNSLYVSKQFPIGTVADWDTSTVYAGSSAAGVIQIDNNTDDAIVGLTSFFGQLNVFRGQSIHVVSGTAMLSMTIEKSLNAKGVLAPRSISINDGKKTYFVGRQGVKQLSGVTVQDGTTEFDSISTDSIDRRIRPLIEGVYDQRDFVGYAYKDKYYLSDPNSDLMFVFDEITGGWSRWTIGSAEVFIEDGDELYIAKGNQYYKLASNPTGSVESFARTKDYNLDTDLFYKVFEKLIATFRTKSEASTFTLYWYINGSTTYSGSKEITIQSNAITWDGGYFWDNESVKWDMGSINFLHQKQRKLSSGITIAFGVKATGANRFSLNALDLVFEVLKKEV